MIHPDELTPARLLAEMDAALEPNGLLDPLGMRLHMDGVEKVSGILAWLLNARGRATPFASAQEMLSDPSAASDWGRRKTPTRRLGDKTVGDISIQ